MFAIFKDKEFHDNIWDQHASDEYINPKELSLEYLETFNPELLQTEDIHFFSVEEEEGIIGKVTLSHTSRFSEDIPFLSIDKPLTDSAMIIKDVDYYINGKSHLHEDILAFEILTHKFYKNILKNGLWICHKLSIKNIISISAHIDDHEDLAYWGDFEFSTYWETPHNVIGIVSYNIDKGNKLQDTEVFAHSIKLISNISYEEDGLY